jgi:hypothetical protein
MAVFPVAQIVGRFAAKARSVSNFLATQELANRQGDFMGVMMS